MEFDNVKLPLITVLKDPDRTLPIINSIVSTSHQLNERVMLFLKKLSLKYDYEINLNLIELLFLVVGTRSRHKALSMNQDLFDELTKIYQREFEPLLPEDCPDLSLEYMKNINSYLATRIFTNYGINVQENYLAYVRDLVRTYFSDPKSFVEEKKNRAEYSKLLGIITNNVVLPLYGGRKYLPKLHRHMEILHKIAVPDEGVKKHLDSSGDEVWRYTYDIKVRPMAYFEVMKRISRICQLMNPNYRLRNLYPLQRSSIPGHVLLDTTTVNKFFTDNGKKTIYRQNHGKYQNEIWDNLIYRTNRVFKNRKKKFYYLLSTDGISVSLYFSNREKGSRSGRKTKKISEEEPYLKDLPQPQRESLLGAKVVGIDPGKSELLFCVGEDSTAKDPKVLRYTQNQRNVDCRKRRNQQILANLQLNALINGKTLKELEADLSQVVQSGHKTMSIFDYDNYLRAKLLYNHRVREHYQEFAYRKLRLNTYINTKKSEAKFIRQFKKKFGEPDKVVIGYGNWSEGKHRKGTEPVKGAGFRKMFREAGYTVGLVDEFRTSKCCSYCREPDHFCENAYRNRIGKNGVLKLKKIHGLLRCNDCKSYLNRNINGGSNITIASRCALEGKDRPDYLRRVVANY